MPFDGETYQRSKDRKRLQRQLDRVAHLMRDSRWRTLAELELLLNAPQASISARLRDLRKEKFGGFHVNRRRRSPGTFEYQVVVPQPAGQGMIF